MDAATRRLWNQRLQQWRFFALALIAHVILGVVLWGKVMFEGFNPKKSFVSSGLIVGDGLGSPPPPPPPAPSKSSSFSANASASAGVTAPEQFREIIKASGPSAGFSLPQFLPPAPTMPSASGAGSLTPSAVDAASILEANRKALAGIQAFSKDWVKKGSGSGGVRGIAAEFSVYVADLHDSYSIALREEDNADKSKAFYGAIPNLAEMVNDLSKNKIQMKLDAKPVKLESEEYIKQKAPFLFLAGTRDFVLTDAQIEKLRRYLRMGGCLWADSSVPGRGTPFDAAFRREIKRVIPDDDKPLEPITLQHPIFERGYSPMREIPSGINFIKNPAEAIRVEGVEAVIYTSNGYSTQWQVPLDSANRSQKFDATLLSVQGFDRFVFNNQKSIFRNLSPATLLDSYRLGLNIVSYLLIRYESKLRSGGSL